MGFIILLSLWVDHCLVLWYCSVCWGCHSPTNTYEKSIDNVDCIDTQLGEGILQVLFKRCYRIIEYEINDGHPRNFSMVSDWDLFRLTSSSYIVCWVGFLTLLANLFIDGGIEEFKCLGEGY